MSNNAEKYAINQQNVQHDRWAQARGHGWEHEHMGGSDANACECFKPDGIVSASVVARNATVSPPPGGQGSGNTVLLSRTGKEAENKQQLHLALYAGRTCLSLASVLHAVPVVLHRLLAGSQRWQGTTQRTKE